MNRRQEQLLKIVLKTPGCSVRELAARLGVSERTIRNDIRDLPGLSGGRKGVRASETAARILEETSAVPQDQDGRILWLVRQVLLEGESPEFEEVCDRLAVSPSTLKADIMLFNRHMEGTGCRIRLRQKHICSAGQEDQIRQALRRIIRESATDAFIHPAFLKTVYDPDLVDAVETVCTNWLSQNRTEPNDLLWLTLIQHCTLISARNPSGEPVHDGLAGLLETATGRRFSDADAKACHQLEQQARGTDQIRPEIRAFAGEMVDYLESRYAIRLDRDSFLPLFESHLQQLETRIGSGKSQENPMTESIRKQSPFVFDMAVDVAGFFESRFGCSLTEDEIAFFALHIGSSLGLQTASTSVQVVCPNYHGLRDSFLKTLRTAFPGQVVFLPVEAGSVTPDLPVISAVPLKIPHLQVAAFPGPEDMTRIRQYLEEGNRRRAFSVLDHLFSGKRFSVVKQDLQLQDREAVIRFLSDQMIRDGLSDVTLASRVLDRERMVSTAFGGFAIPHAMQDQAGQSGIAVALFPEGLDWNGTTVKAVFLLQVASAQAGGFEHFYSRFIRLLQNPDVLERLVRTPDFDSFREKLADSWIAE